VNEGDDEDRLPVSVGGLLGFAAASYLERAPLYLALAALAFAIDALVQLLTPDRFAPHIAGMIVGDALVIATIALGIGTRAAATTASAAKLLEAAVVRWGDVAGASGLATLIAFTLVQRAALPIPADGPLGYLAAPPAWLLMGALAMAGPVTALGHDRPILAILTGLGRALALSLRFVNLGRLALVAVAVMAVIVMQTALGYALVAQHAAHVNFWADAPLDALTVGPLTALQATFALDFARRVGRLGAPRR
jgi:hypothetical protein